MFTSSVTFVNSPLLHSTMQSTNSTEPSTRLVFIFDPDRTASGAGASSNAVRTTKYSLLTFLPRNLFEQFRRVAYVYFLLLALLNQIPQLTVFGRQTAFIPLAVVLVLTALKDAYEDFRRHRSDVAENNRTAAVLQCQYPHHRPRMQLVSKSWKDVMPGDVVRVEVDEAVPCDMALLATSDPSGLAYVQTANLDGESNLKSRYARIETAGRMLEEDSTAGGGVVRCGAPKMDIYEFHATLELDDGRRLPLGPENVVLRGCVIKNTAWVLGVAVYVGMETKVMLNGSVVPSKRSRLEKRMNREILVLAAIMVCICCVIAACTGVWLHRNRDKLDVLPFYRRKEYLNGGEKDYLYSGLALEVVFSFLMSVMVFQNFIPISLYISMELARLMQSFMMTQDPSMRDDATGVQFQCRALNINEDLGQIKYVFSDKTGTLTENKMVFRCASVYGVDYSDVGSPLLTGANDGCQVWRPKVVVSPDQHLLSLLRAENGTEETLHAHYFFVALTTCNTVVPQIVETSDPLAKLIQYQGESPDEQALLYAAAAYGYVLIERTSGYIIVDVLGERQRFEVLGLHEFDSDRKKMSVVVCCPDKSVKLFVKGADSVMFRDLAKSCYLDKVNETAAHVHMYSSFGLRTLVIGMKEFDTNEFEDWQIGYATASTELSNRGNRIREVAVRVECNLRLLGATGIEDKLQKGVPEAIEALRNSGIKIFVLTGDKQETAISIGYSCKLLRDNMTQIIINGHSKESCKRSLEDAISICRELALVTLAKSENVEGSRDARVPEVALVIDGPTLVHILESELEDQLFEVATICAVGICCRVAPLQKAGIVAFIKKKTMDMTLSIGDGANDVSMIRTADIGIGISGKEGHQAVMASDYAMGQFRFIVPLLLVHGHWNYQRIGYMILYNFYRNGLFVFIIYWYVYYSAVSLSNPINEINGLLYSAVYTALPTVMVGTYDQNISRKTLLTHPQLYGAGLRDEHYNLKLFLLVLMDTLWQSLVLFYAPLLVYSSTLDYSSLGDLWILSVVLLVNLHLAMDVHSWNWILFATIGGVTALTVVCIFAIDSSPKEPGYRDINHLMSTGPFWLCLILILVSAFFPRFVVKAFAAHLKPSDRQIADESEKFGKHNNVSSGEAPVTSSTNLQEDTTL